MTNTHKLKGWNPGFEPQCEVYQVVGNTAFVYAYGEEYEVPRSWLEPLQDNGIQDTSTESG